jgi:two-component system sensor histidine kinase RstB
MRRLFIRLYAAVVVAILLAFGMVFASVQLSEGIRQPDLAAWADLDRTARGLLTAPDADAALRQLEERLQTSVELLQPGEPDPPVSPGPPWRRPRLVRLDDGRRLVVHPLGEPPLLAPAGLIGVALVAVALAILLWLRPLQRALVALTDASRRLGQADLSARVEVIDGTPTEDLARAFNSMAARIQALVQSQEELLLGVSHELRTPLMRLRFGAELLEAEDDPDTRAARAEEIAADITELDELLTELLTWARLRGAVVLQVAPLTPAALLADVAARTRRLAPDREVRVRREPGRRAPGVLQSVWSSIVPDEHDRPQWTDCDPRLLDRAITNLATNAVRYGDGPIELWYRDLPGERALGVDDHGPGIPAHERDRVLEPFVRLDTSRSAVGFGLGLSLVSRIARLHRGELLLTDAPGGGLRAELRLG